MPYFSNFYQVEVREEIAREFEDYEGKVDDMMAGLHEIRARMSQEDPWLKKIHKKLEERKELSLNINRKIKN